jgi:hypothetical protein
MRVRVSDPGQIEESRGEVHAGGEALDDGARLQALLRPSRVSNDHGHSSTTWSMSKDRGQKVISSGTRRDRSEMTRLWTHLRSYNTCTGGSERCSPVPICVPIIPRVRFDRNQPSSELLNVEESMEIGAHLGPYQANELWAPRFSYELSKYLLTTSIICLPMVGPASVFFMPSGGSRRRRRCQRDMIPCGWGV